MKATAPHARISRRALLGGVGAGAAVAMLAPAGLAAAEALDRWGGSSGGNWRGDWQGATTGAQADRTVAAAAQPPAAPLTAEAIQALSDAIDDEYNARATYRAVIAKFGSVRPFSSIVLAEEAHISALKTVFDRYGIAVPADPYAGNVAAPSTLKEACQTGVDAEIANAALYDRLLAAVTQPDIVSVFTSLRAASLEKHLPAFQRFV